MGEETVLRPRGPTLAMSLSSASGFLDAHGLVWISALRSSLSARRFSSTKSVHGVSLHLCRSLCRNVMGVSQL